MSTSSSNLSMHDLLNLTVEEGASDLHITVGSPPVLRLNGNMQALDSDPLTPEDTQRLMEEITDEGLNNDDVPNVYRFSHTMATLSSSKT